jgi:Putative Ig domain
MYCFFANLALVRGESRSKTPLGLALLVVAASLFAGCSSGGEDSATQQPSTANPPSSGGSTPPVTANMAPTISGSPLTSVMQNTAYSFTPTASDANHDPLTFSIAAKPSWASFNTSTGSLTGTPGAGDVGTYSNIQISVSDGQASVAMTAFSITVGATATGATTLSWTPPAMNTDGTALTDLAGYRIYWGTAQNSYTNSKTLNGPGFSSAVIDQLTPATWYFVVTALDSAGNESAYSNVATKKVM